MISGIKRKKTAIESTFRFFQTVDLIISHIKRDADRQKIFELTSQETTLGGFLIATAAIHIYHNLGIRVNDAPELNKMSIESTINLELKEKRIIEEEVALLLKDSFKLEIDILYKIINLEDKFIFLLIDERVTKLQEVNKKKIIHEIEDQIEQELLEIIRNYPQFYFYDFIGDLIGLTNEIKKEILEESSAFKELSVEIEKKLEQEEKEDKFIELSTLNRLINKLQKDFEFKSHKELQIQAMPVRGIKRKIFEFDFERFPISIPGLKIYQIANKLKKELIKKIENALNGKINYDQFENETFYFLKMELIKQLKTNPNDFIYFLQSLNDCNFNEIIYSLNKYGVYNIPDLINLDNELAAKIKKNMIRYNIKKFDLMSMNDPNKNLIFIVKKAICELNFSILNKINKKNDEKFEFDLLKLLNQDNNNRFQELWKLINEKTGYSLKDIRDFIQKKKIIDKIFINKLQLKGYSQILLLLNFEDIINNLVKDIFFYIISKILRQLSRIIELYLKVSNDKTLALVALKKMHGLTDSEEWVWIKLEELLIKRLTKRQKELVIVFNAMNQPFLVNGFILARLMDTSLKEGMLKLKNETSPIYEEIYPLKLKLDMISPISYCIAYDLIKRFETFEELRKFNIKRLIESKKKEKEHIKKELRKRQKDSTLNWIERRITSSLMRINSPGINPTHLYWQDKDTKITTDNIKLHSESKGNSLEIFSQYFHFAIEKIRFFMPDLKLPNYEKIMLIVRNMVEDLLQQRLHHKPNPEEIRNIIDGERFEIARQIAIKIGQFLDKALYSKFKNKQRYRKNNM